MQSLVLGGRVTNIEYRPQAPGHEDLPTHYAWATDQGINAKTHSRDCMHASDNGVVLTCAHQCNYCAGDVYSVHVNQPHETNCGGPAVTLMTKGRDVEGTQARVFVPVGQAPDLEFDPAAYGQDVLKAMVRMIWDAVF